MAGGSEVGSLAATFSQSLSVSSYGIGDFSFPDSGLVRNHLADPDPRDRVMWALVAFRVAPNARAL